MSTAEKENTVNDDIQTVEILDENGELITIIEFSLYEWGLIQHIMKTKNMSLEDVVKASLEAYVNKMN